MLLQPSPVALAMFESLGRCVAVEDEEKFRYLACAARTCCICCVKRIHRMWWITCDYSWDINVWDIPGNTLTHTHTKFVEDSGLMGNLYKQQLTVQKWLEPGTYALDPKCDRYKITDDFILIF